MSARRVKLSEVVSINPKTDTSIFDLQDKVAFIAMADVSEQGKVANVQSRFGDEVKKGYTCFQNGDVILAKITPCFENGKAAQVDGLFSAVGFGSTEFHVLRPSKEIDGRFLFHLVWNENFRRSGELRMTGSAGQKRVPTKFLEEYEIDLPPLKEQKRIAAILDKADSLRRKRAQAIAVADDFLRATFLEMFGDPVTNPKGWPVKNLNEVVDVRDGTHDTPKYVEDGYPLITTKNLRNGAVCFEGCQYISEADHLLIAKRSAVSQGDILIPMIGTIGVPAVVDVDFEFSIKNLALIKKPSSDGLACYLFSLIESPFFEWAITKNKRGGTQKFVSLGDLRAMSIPLPPDVLLGRYLKVARFVGNMKNKIRKHDLALNDLNSSLASQAM